jgi:chemotaxis response regulator CheB
MTAAETDGGDRRRGGITADKIRILIVDDHALFRVGIANILGKERDLDVVGEAAEGRSALEMSGMTSPNIVLMDLSLPAPGGLETTQRIRREYPAVAVIVMAVCAAFKRKRAVPKDAGLAAPVEVVGAVGGTSCEFDRLTANSLVWLGVMPAFVSNLSTY